MVDIVRLFRDKKRSIGAILLVIAVYLYLQGYEISLDVSSLGFLVFVCLIVGIVLFFYDYTRRQLQ